ncbi:SRPBCC family protein [Nocardia sp. NPDC060256]|uniref:SRPBCC family protein n=1 Tax=unclassified Nocardia TaxID=2637762 RepID=UPI00364D6494
MDYPEHPDTDAAVVVEQSIRIGAPIERVWALHTAIGAWTTWRTDITEATMDEPLKPGSTFHWHTPRIGIESTIYAVDAPHRILWGGSQHGITGIHLWTFEADDDGTLVHSTMSWDGDPVRADLDNQRDGLANSMHVWLEKLRETAESAA